MTKQTTFAVRKIKMRARSPRLTLNIYKIMTDDLKQNGKIAAIKTT